MAEAMLHTAYQDRSADLTKGAKKKMMKWKCLICGYIYEGEELPADFVCPICKQGADKFVKSRILLATRQRILMLAQVGEESVRGLCWRVYGS
mgnify:CR=1 FL=1